MTHHCSICGGRGLVNDSKATTTSRRRRFKCRECGYRWTEWDGPRPERKPAQLSAEEQAIAAVPGLRMTPEQVRLVILRTDISHREMGRLMGRGRDAIAQARHGRRYAQILPELKRWTRPEKPLPERSCLQCQKWTGQWCADGWPDPLTDGFEVATLCDDYELLQPAGPAQ